MQIILYKHSEIFWLSQVNAPYTPLLPVAAWKKILFIMTLMLIMISDNGQLMIIFMVKITIQVILRIMKLTLMILDQTLLIKILFSKSQKKEEKLR